MMVHHYPSLRYGNETAPHLAKKSSNRHIMGFFFTLALMTGFGGIFDWHFFYVYVSGCVYMYMIIVDVGQGKFLAIRVHQGGAPRNFAAQEEFISCSLRGVHLRDRTWVGVAGQIW